MHTVHVNHLPKTKKIQKFKETGHSTYINPNELDKACFQQDKAYEDFKYWGRRRAFNEASSDKAFNITKNLKYDGYGHGPVSKERLLIKF